MPAYQPPTTITRAQFTWHINPDGAPRIEVRGFAEDGLVLLSQAEQEAALQAFYDLTSPQAKRADAATQGFLQTVSLLQWVVDRLVVPDAEEGATILMHPDGKPIVSDEWLNVATAFFPPPPELVAEDGDDEAEAASG